jgi:hypothetical protein
MPDYAAIKRGADLFRDYASGKDTGSVYTPDKVQRETPGSLGQPQALSTKWTTAQVNNLWTAASASATKPEWFAYVDAAKQYQTQTGGDALPQELVSILDMLPQQAAPAVEDVLTPPWQQVYGARAPAGLPEAPYADYGLSLEQWNSLDPWKKLSMRMQGTNTATAMTTGGVAALQGGIKAVPYGVALGFGIGKAAEKWPALGKITEAFDYLVENLVMKPYGMMSMAQELQRQGRSPQELADKLENAWTASEQAARVNLVSAGKLDYVTGAGSRGMAEPLAPLQGTEVWAGPQDPMASHNLTYEQLGPKALIEYFDRLNTEKQSDLDAEYTERYGWQGQMTDLGVRIGLDPLNIIGPVSTEVLGGVARLAGASPEFVHIAQTSEGLIRARKELRKIFAGGMLGAYGDMKPFEKWFLGNVMTKQGELRKWSVQFKHNYQKTAAGIFSLTPQSRGDNMFKTAGNYLGRIAEHPSVHLDDPDGMFKVLNMASKNGPVAGRDISMRMLDSPEWSMLGPAIREYADDVGPLRADLDNYHMLDEPRNLMGRIAKAVGEDVGGVIKKLSGEDAQKNAQLYKVKLGEADITAELIQASGKAMEGQPTSGKMMVAKMVLDTMDEVGNYAVKRFGITEDSVPTRWFNFWKGAQGALLLDWSLNYHINNPTNNLAMLLREGLLFPNPMQKDMLNRLFPEFLPSSIKETLVTDTANIPGNVKSNPIQSATRAKKQTIAEQGLDWMRGKMKGGWLQGKEESIGRTLAYAVGAPKNYDRVWVKGIGYDLIPRDIEGQVPTGFVREIYDTVSNSVNVEEARKSINDVIAKWNKPGEVDLRPTPSMVLNDAIENLPIARDIDRQMINDLDIDVWLDENTIGIPREDIPLKYGELDKIAIKRLMEWQKKNIKAEFETYDGIGKLEGEIGIFRKLDQVISDPSQLISEGWMDMDDLWAKRGTMPDDKWVTLLRLKQATGDDAWSIMTRSQKAFLEGAAEGLGLTADTTSTLLKSIDDASTIRTDYFKLKRKELNDFFKKVKDEGFKTRELANQAYNDMRVRHTNLYIDDNIKIEEILLRQDMELVDALVARYGEDARAPAEAWRESVRNDRIAYQDEVVRVWRETEGLPMNERLAIFHSFIHEKALPAQRQVVVTSGEGANATYRAAVDAERSGVLPPEKVAQSAQPPAPAVAKNPVGVAPPGTVEHITGQIRKPIFEEFNETWRDQVKPILREMERNHTDPANWGKAQTGTLSPDVLKGLYNWAERGVLGRMPDAKLAAFNLTKVGVDAAMLDYNERYGADNLANIITPYQFWYTRSGVNWAITAIDKPYYLANWWRLRKMQEDMSRPVEGFPQRLSGKLQAKIPKILRAFIPEDWGDTIYYDPLHQIFTFEMMAAQATRPLQRDFSNQSKRAEYILYEKYEAGDISKAEYTAAINSAENKVKPNPLWVNAFEQAKTEIDAEVARPMDLASAMLGFSLPLQWALSTKGVREGLDKAGLGFLGLTERNNSVLPSFATIQSATSYMVPGGINLVEAFDLAIGKPTEGARGFLWNYFTGKELANMAIQGTDATAAMQAMIDKQGPLYEQAVTTVGRQGGWKQLLAVVWGDFFPEGEQQQIALKYAFNKAIEEGKLSEFMEKNPAYRARVINQAYWEKPEDMMRYFLRSSLWDSYNKKSDLERREATAQLDAASGDLFTDAFINKETRSYDSISTETMLQWARALKGAVPQTAPETPPMPLELPVASLSQQYDSYVQWRDTQPGYALQGAYYGLPVGMRDNFKLQHPEMVAYQDARYMFMAEHPELVPYMIGEDSFMAGASPEVQFEVIDYYAERATYFPGVKWTEAVYYTLGKGEQRTFLKQHPELKAYWSWNDDAVADMSNDAWYYAASDSKIEKARYGDKYEAAYRVNYDQFSPDLTLAIMQNNLLDRNLGDGAKRQLTAIWEADGKPFGTFAAWLERVLSAFAIPQ